MIKIKLIKGCKTKIRPNPIIFNHVVLTFWRPCDINFTMIGKKSVNWFFKVV